METEFFSRVGSKLFDRNSFELRSTDLTRQNDGSRNQREWEENSMTHSGQGTGKHSQTRIGYIPRMGHTIGNTTSATAKAKGTSADVRVYRSDFPPADE